MAAREGDSLVAPSSSSGGGQPTRASLVDRLRDLVLARGAQQVVIGTGLVGAGGFGKTTVARQVFADERVVRRFADRRWWVTVGQGAKGAELASRINAVGDTIGGFLSPESDPDEAGRRLGDLFGDLPGFLVVDDVWTAEQVRPFLVGAPNCVKLFITRMPNLFDAAVPVVRVDTLTADQAMELVGADLGRRVSETAVAELAGLTGRWPLLCALVNGALRDQMEDGASMIAAATETATRLRERGAAHMDLTHSPGRDKALTAAVEASLGLLGEQDRRRYLELGIFPADTEVPLDMITRLWGVTGGMDAVATERLCDRLAKLSLLERHHDEDGGAVSLHDVLRTYARGVLQRVGIVDAHLALLDGAWDLLDGGRSAVGGPIPWWTLPAHAHYLWHHLVYHLVEVDMHDSAADLVMDLRWIAARLHHGGPVAVEADLSTVHSEAATRMRHEISRHAELLTPIEPPHALTAILLSRLDRLSGLEDNIAACSAEFPHARLLPWWPLPDQAAPALLRMLTTGGARWLTCAIAPDGTWFATAGADGAVRLWDTKTRSQRAVLVGHTDMISACAIAPDGTWLATTGADGTVRLWDVETRSQRTMLIGHTGMLSACAIGPDGTWLATTGADGVVRLWDVTLGKERVVLAGHDGWVLGCAIAPDGTWLASGGEDGTVRLWDAATGRQRAVLDGHTDLVSACAIAPDGTWLVSAGHDGTVRIWDAATGGERAALDGHEGPVLACAIAPDGSWFASAGKDGKVRIWDAATRRERAVLSEYAGAVRACPIAPDGTWLATIAADRPVRLWDPVAAKKSAVVEGHADWIEACAIAVDSSWLVLSGSDGTLHLWEADRRRERAVLSGHDGWISACAIAPDGTWLASAGDDGTVRLWDVETVRQIAALDGRAGPVLTCAIAPDGTWLASAGHDGRVHLWDAETRRERAALDGHDGWVLACAIAPDGTWLVSAGQDGTVRIWDEESRRERALLEGHDGPVLACAIAPDGTWLATGGSDGSVRLWDALTGAEKAVLAGHDSWVQGCAVHSDGAWLASVDSDGAVRLWDVATGECLTALRTANSLQDCRWFPGRDALCAVGAQGVYTFTALRPAAA